MPFTDGLRTEEHAGRGVECEHYVEWATRTDARFATHFHERRQCVHGRGFARGLNHEPGLVCGHDHGRVRAELKITAALPDLKMPDGTTGFPESVLFRLISSKGGPNVKLGATEDGSGLVLGGEKTYVQILSRGTADPFVKIVTNDGREQVFKPSQNAKPPAN